VRQWREAKQTNKIPVKSGRDTRPIFLIDSNGYCCDSHTNAHQILGLSSVFG
jgi:hypothetical protein